MVTPLHHAARVGWRPGGLHRLSTPSGAVRYRVSQLGPGERPSLVVALHGYGSDARQAGSLLGLDVPTLVLAPRAPIPLAAGGWSWFPVDLRTDGSPLVRAAAVGVAVRRVADFARAAAHAWHADPSRVALVGYSQGGTVALSAALAAPAPFVAVAALSGSAVAAHLDAATRRAPFGVPLFVGHGRIDPAVPIAEMRTAVTRLRAAGRDVAFHEADAPHVVTVGQRADLSTWLTTRLSVPNRSASPR